jgi:hypothetical protein
LTPAGDQRKMRANDAPSQPRAPGSTRDGASSRDRWRKRMQDETNDTPAPLGAGSEPTVADAMTETKEAFAVTAAVVSNAVQTAVKKAKAAVKRMAPKKKAAKTKAKKAAKPAKKAKKAAKKVARKAKKTAKKTVKKAKKATKKAKKAKAKK